MTSKFDKRDYTDFEIATMLWAMVNGDDGSTVATWFDEIDTSKTTIRIVSTDISPLHFLTSTRFDILYVKNKQNIIFVVVRLLIVSGR